MTDLSGTWYSQLVQCGVLRERVIPQVAYAVVTEVESAESENAIHCVPLDLTDPVVMTGTDQCVNTIHCEHLQLNPS